MACLTATTIISSTFATALPASALKFGNNSSPQQTTEQKKNEEKKPKKEISHKRSIHKSIFAIQHEIMQIDSSTDRTKLIKLSKRNQQRLEDKCIREIASTNPLHFEEADSCSNWELVPRRKFMSTTPWEIFKYPNANSFLGKPLSSLGFDTFHIYTNKSAEKTASECVKRDNDENSFSSEEFDNELEFFERKEEKEIEEIDKQHFRIEKEEEVEKEKQFFKTATGKSYHKEGCYILKGKDYVSVTDEQIRSEYLTPCKKCQGN